MRFRRLPLQIVVVSSIVSKTAFLFLLLAVFPRRLHIWLATLFVVLIIAQLLILRRTIRGKSKPIGSNPLSSK